MPNDSRLDYAIEKLSERERQQYLQAGKV